MRVRSSSARALTSWLGAYRMWSHLWASAQARGLARAALMIRKPPANWNRPDEGAVVRTVRVASALAQGGASVARRGKQIAVGLYCFFFASLWSSIAIVSGLELGLPTLIGIWAMTISIFLVGCRAF